MKLKSYKIIFVIILYFLLLISSFAITYSYYSSQKEYGIILETGNFEVDIYVSFNGEIIDVNSPYYNQENNVVRINSYDQLSHNYIGKLKISVSITPAVSARVRFKIMDEWELTRTYLNQNPEYPISPVVQAVYHNAKDVTYYPFSLLKLDASIEPLYDMDQYLHYHKILSKGKKTIIDLIDGGDSYPIQSNDIYEETVYLKLGLIVDVIQANRIQELWGLDAVFFLD